MPELQIKAIRTCLISDPLVFQFFHLRSREEEKSPLWRLFLFVHVDSCTSGESLTESFVELREMHLARSDAECDRDDGSQQFTVFPGRDSRGWQCVHPVQSQFLCRTAHTHLEDIIIRRFQPEPRTKDVSDAEAFALPFKEPSRALQLEPELHETFQSIGYAFAPHDSAIQTSLMALTVWGILNGNHIEEFLMTNDLMT